MHNPFEWYTFSMIKRYKIFYILRFLRKETEESVNLKFVMKSFVIAWLKMLKIKHNISRYKKECEIGLPRIFYILSSVFGPCLAFIPFHLLITSSYWKIGAHYWRLLTLTKLRTMGTSSKGYLNPPRRIYRLSQKLYDYLWSRNSFW